MVLIFIFGFIIGLFIFLFINNVFEIYYFGFKGMLGTFMGCWFAGNIIVYIFGFLAKWILIISIVIWLISKIVKKAKN